MDNGCSFYGKAFAGIPSKIYYLKSTLDIVKELVLSSISWTTYKNRNITNAEYSTFKEFIAGIPVNDIVSKIRTKCRCSNPAAKKLLDEFLNEVWKYVDGDSLEDEIILSAISASNELQEKTKALIRTDWEKEYTSLLAEAQEKLNSLEAEYNSAVTSLTEAQKTLQATKLEEQKLAEIIADKEKLAEDVEKAVAARIQKAQESVAEFIANMAFIGGQPIQIASPKTSATVEVSSQSVITPYRTFSTLDELNNLEAHHTWADVINTTAAELGEAGVAGTYTSGLAAFLCAAYIEKQPILLVGPNAIDIAQAFSTAVTSHSYGVLCCEGEYNNQIITDTIGTNGEKIVIINNLISSGWLNRLPEILLQKDIFYIATHPYAEDIQVEPKSLYGFMLPLFSEFFVDNKATGEYHGGYFADDFKTYSASQRKSVELEILSKFMLSPLVRNRINNLVATMRDIYPATTADEEFLFAILPIVYASLALNELTEALANPQKGIKISGPLKKNLKYILEEVMDK